MCSFPFGVGGCPAAGEVEIEPLAVAAGDAAMGMGSVVEWSLGASSWEGETLGTMLPFGLVVDVVTDKDEVAVVVAPCTAPSILAAIGLLVKLQLAGFGALAGGQTF